MPPLTLTIGGVSRGAVIDRGSFVVSQKASGVATAEFTILDPSRTITVADDAVVVAADGATTVFGGLARDIRTDRIGRTRIITVACQDYNALLDEDAIPAPASRSASETDKQRVEWLFSTHGTKGITAGTFVQTVHGSMPGGEDGIPRQEFGGKTFREALDYIARLTGAAYYVDFDKAFHWFPVAGEGLTAPFALSDTPNYSTTFPHSGLHRPRDVSGYRNAVYVMGDGISGWRPNPPPGTSTRRAGVLRDEGITSQAQLDAAGDAYLDDHGVKTHVELDTLTAGLKVGMTVQVTDALTGLSATPLMVREVQTRLNSRTVPVYHCMLGDGSFGLGAMVGGAAATAERALETAVAAGNAVAGGQPVADLQIGGANLVPNSSFENQIAPGWTVGANWVFGLPVSDAISGVAVARLDESAYAGTDDTLISPEVAAAITDDYWISAWINVRSRSAGTFTLALRQKNAGGTVLTTTTLASLTAVTSGWQRFSVRMGPNTSYGRTQWTALVTKVDIIAEATGTATLVADVDGVQIERSSLLTAYAPAPYELMDNSIYGDHVQAGAIGSVQIADDSITTPHLAAAAVDATKIAANAVVAGKIAAGTITSAHIAASGIDADHLKAGTLRLGTLAGYPDVLIVYDADGDEIGRWGSTGLLITDAGDPLMVVRLQNGVLEFSEDGGSTWLTAISGQGINADAIRFGTFPGGSNRVPNSGFELAQFQTPLTKVWTSSSDWGTTIGTDVNVTKTGSSLVMTTTAY